jgi:hypothetical protein
MRSYQAILRDMLKTNVAIYAGIFSDDESIAQPLMSGQSTHGNRENRNQ